MSTQTERKHTPGPWSVMWQNSRAREYGGGWRSWETPVQVGPRETAGNVLCTVTMGGPGAGQSDQATVEANARLIAAAPEMYEALKALVDEFGCSIEQYHKIGPDWTHKDGTETLNASTLLDREPLIEAARDAIAKAEAAA